MAKLAAKFIAVVVFPTPPFWLAIAIILVIGYRLKKLISIHSKQGKYNDSFAFLGMKSLTPNGW
jgi:flagellar biogenesis protein FliO